MQRIDVVKYRSDYRNSQPRRVFNTNEPGWFLTDEEFKAIRRLYLAESALTDRVAIINRRGIVGTKPHLVQHQRSDMLDLDKAQLEALSALQDVDRFIVMTDPKPEA